MLDLLWNDLDQLLKLLELLGYELQELLKVNQLLLLKDLHLLQLCGRICNSCRICGTGDAAPTPYPEID